MFNSDGAILTPLILSNASPVARLQWYGVLRQIPTMSSLFRVSGALAGY